MWRPFRPLIQSEHCVKTNVSLRVTKGPSLYILPTKRGMTNLCTLSFTLKITQVP